MPQRIRLTSALLLCTAAMAVSACSGGLFGGHHADDRGPAGYQRIYSPNGEPLSGGVLGHPACEAALSGWFHRVGGGHDGPISHDAFMADAQQQFDRMDIRHSGFITASDLEVFRAPYQDPIAPDPVPRTDGDHPPGTRHHGAGGAAQSTRSRGSPVDLSADPVMSADTSLRFKVSREDFIRQAQEAFTHLDADHDGTLSRAEVLQECPRKTP